LKAREGDAHLDTDDGMKRTLELMVEASGESVASWGELRSALASDRGALLWYAVKRIVMAWPDDDEADEVVIPYLLREQKLMGITHRSINADTEVTELVAKLKRGRVPAVFGLATELELYEQSLSEKDIEMLARSPHLSECVALDLSQNEIGDKGIIALARSPYVEKIKTLLLSDNRIADQGVEAIANSPYLKNIEMLRLDDNEMYEDGFFAIAKSKYMRSLKYLDVHNNHIGDIPWDIVEKSKTLKNVRMTF
jgi:hypothetical protein